MKDLKIALVCDWLTNVGGAEKVLLKIHQLFPTAPIYTSQYDKKGIDWFKNADVRTGWLQIFPTRLRRFLAPLRQIYFSRLNLSKYDLIISVTGAEAKAVKCKNSLHICYCHVPTQYYWQMYDDYLKKPGFGLLDPIVRFFFKLLVKPLRQADLRASARPNYFVTISGYAKQQIRKYYNRDATIIHPPVEVEDFALSQSKSSPMENPVENFPIQDAYITTSRQVNWKRLDLCIEACLKIQKPLLIIGEGPEHEALVRLANNSPLIKFLPLMTKHELKFYLKNAKAFLFPSLEPFGIAPVEALSAGCPVIAFGKGGSLDYIKPGENGLLFSRQSVSSLTKVLHEFDQLTFDRQKISRSVAHFSASRFDKELMDFINEQLQLA